MDILLEDGIIYNTNSLMYYMKGEEISKTKIITFLQEKYVTRDRLLREFFKLGSGSNDKTRSPLFMKNIGKDLLNHFPH